MGSDSEREESKRGKPLSRRELLRLLSMAALVPSSAELLGAPPKPARVKVPRTARPVTKRPSRVLAVGKDPLHGVVTAAAPMNNEEEELAAILADQINHAMAVVASDPRGTFPSASLAGKIRKPFLKLDTNVKSTARRRAQDLLSKPSAERRKYFGTYGDKSPEVHRRGRTSPDAQLRRKIRQVTRKRVDSYKHVLRDLLVPHLSL